MLHRTEMEFPSREEWLDMDDRWLVNVLARPDFHKGDKERGYWPVGRADVDDPRVEGSLGPKALWWSTTGKNMRKLGFSEEEIETQYKEWRKDILLKDG